MVGAVLHYLDYEYETWQSHFYILNLDFYFIVLKRIKYFACSSSSARLMWISEQHCPQDHTDLPQ